MLGQPDILAAAKPDLEKSSSLKVFCLKIKSSLKAYSDKAKTLSETGEVSRFLAFGVQPTNEVTIIIIIIITITIDMIDNLLEQVS